MASKKKKSLPVVRCFEVSNPTLHEKGHTVYQVTQKIIKVDVPDEEVQEVVVWRRYNEFKKLYKAMSKLHQALHRREEFPPFSNPKVFGRFDNAVVQERMLCAQDLLNFVGQRHYMVASKAFQQFFEGGEVIQNTLRSELLQPDRLDQEDKQLYEAVAVAMRRGAAGEEDLADSPTLPPPSDVIHPASLLQPEEPLPLHREPSMEQILGGVWRFRQIAEEISLGGDEDDDEQTDYTDDSALSTPLPQADLSFFDPLRASDSLDPGEDRGGGGGGGGGGTSPGLGQGEKSGGRAGSGWVIGDWEGDEGEDGLRIGGESEYPRDDPGGGGGGGGGGVGGGGEGDEAEELRRLEAEFASCGVIPTEDPGGRSVGGSNSAPTSPSPSHSPSPSPSRFPSDGSARNTNTMDVTDGVSIPSSDQRQEPGSAAPAQSRTHTPGGIEPTTTDHDDALGPFVGAGTNNKPKSGSIVERGKGDLLASPMHQPQPPSFFQPLQSLTSTPSASPQHSGPGSATGSGTTSPSRSHSLVSIDVKEKADYIFLAANQISLAQQCEAGAKFHMAFSYYKSAVGILLTGVQRDENKTRREVVRKKTAKYLLKAEELYHKYMDRRESGHQERWDTGKPSPVKELDPNVAFLQGSLSEMNNFKVLGVVDKVLLVMDTLTDKTYIIKVLPKSCSPPQHRGLVPTHIPYMVQLFKFYETSYAIYLLLQHATGGKLWSYISGYLCHQPPEVDLGHVLNDPHERHLRMRTETEACNGGSSAAVASTVAGQLADVKEGTPSTTRNGPDTENVSRPSPTSGGDRCSMSYAKLFLAESRGDDENLGGESARSRDSSRESPPPPAGDDADTVAPSGNGAERTDSTGLEIGVNPESHSGSALRKMWSPLEPDPEAAGVEDGMNPPGPGAWAGGGKEGRAASMSEGGFDVLLEGTKGHPSLEQFSINSFDSDGGGPSTAGSRFESTTSEHIESIPEMNEASSPVSTPEREKAKAEPGGLGDAFADGKGSQDAVAMATTARAPDGDADVFTSRSDIVASAERLLSSVRNELDIIIDDGGATVAGGDNDSALGSGHGRDRALHPGAVANSNGTPAENASDGGATLSQSVSSQQSTSSPGDGEGEGDEEASIYDRYRPMGDSDSSACSPVHAPSPPGRSPTPSLGENGPDLDLALDPVVTASTPKRPPPARGGDASTVGSRRPPIFRVQSQEHSVDGGDQGGRKRTLSSVFGSLDLGKEVKVRGSVRLPEGCVRQWATEVIVALNHLHGMGIVCRDLRPDNILLGDRGHVLLTYFSQWGCVDNALDADSIGRLYAAPETRGVLTPSDSCDWWSLGALLYELLTGQSLSTAHPGGVTSHTHICIPEHLSTEAQSLLRQLLKFSPLERLGGGAGGVDDIKMHPFFHDVDWSNLAGCSS